MHDRVYSTRIILKRKLPKRQPGAELGNRMEDSSTATPLRGLEPIHKVDKLPQVKVEADKAGDLRAGIKNLHIGDSDTGSHIEPVGGFRSQGDTEGQINTMNTEGGIIKVNSLNAIDKFVEIKGCVRGNFILSVESKIRVKQTQDRFGKITDTLESIGV